MDVKIVFSEPFEGMTRTTDNVLRVEISTSHTVGAADADKIIILDAEDSLDIIVESAGDRECIHSWLKEPQL